MPAKAFFYRGVWPAGYQFPACISCNNSTSAADQVVSILSRIGAQNAETEEQRAEGEEHLAKLLKHYPALAQEMNELSPHAVRAAIRSGALDRIPGTPLRQHPLLAVPPKLQASIRLFGAKMALAAHYLHTGRIVPITTPVLVRWYGLAEANAGKIPPAIMQFSQVPTIVAHNGHSLTDQFDYRYEASSDGEDGMYTFALRRTFLITTMITKKHFEDVPVMSDFIERPFGRAKV